MKYEKNLFQPTRRKMSKTGNGAREERLTVTLSCLPRTRVLVRSGHTDAMSFGQCVGCKTEKTEFERLPAVKKKNQSFSIRQRRTQRTCITRHARGSRHNPRSRTVFTYETVQSIILPSVTCSDDRVDRSWFVTVCSQLKGAQTRQKVGCGCRTKWRTRGECVR